MKSLVFMGSVGCELERVDYFLDVVVVVVSEVSVLVTAAGAARRTTTLLTTGWPFSVV